MFINFINPEVILVGVLLYVVVGMVYYSPFLFGTLWMEAKELTKEDTKNSTQALFISVLSSLVGVLITILFVQALGFKEFIQGVQVGLLLALFAGMSTVNPIVFDKQRGVDKRLKIWLIDLAYLVLVYTLVAGTTAVWMKG